MPVQPAESVALEASLQENEHLFSQGFLGFVWGNLKNLGKIFPPAPTLG